MKLDYLFLNFRVFRIGLWILGVPKTENRRPGRHILKSRCHRTEPKPVGGSGFVCTSNGYLGYLGTCSTEKLLNMAASYRGGETCSPGSEVDTSHFVRGMQ